jgi:hypothetical protein
MGKKIKAEFQHPDPDENKMISFCKYWKESWTEKDLFMDGPSSNPAATPDTDATPDPADITDLSTAQLSPTKWLAIVYPYREGGEEKWLDEMPLLEKAINGKYKGRVRISNIGSENRESY